MTEGVKHDTGKPRMELIPPEAMFALADILTSGAEKYGDRNWEMGMGWSRVFGGCMRHAWCWFGGKGPARRSFIFEDADLETGRSHLWHLMTGVAFLVVYEERGIGTDDRP
jgi:hypothetical protein